ncbi:MAG: sodium:proton antiporter [Pseudomonadota bacterium]
MNHSYGKVGFLWVLVLVVTVFLLQITSVWAGEHSVRADQRESAHGEALHSGDDKTSGEEHLLGGKLPLWSVIPFAGILLSIALFPLFAPHFWHNHFPKISAFWALVFAIPFLIVYGDEALYEILHIYFIDYIPFIILLWALFTISGGILVKGTLRGTPLVNTAILLIGTIIASWVGTTGASMLLIRPILRANADRKRKIHIVVFFIFLVSNIGGSLTPLGDPPLFLGFLHGVPFFWTFNIFPHMAFVSLILLPGFFLFDYIMYTREKVPKESIGGEMEPIRVEGLFNLLFLGGVLGAVLLSGFWRAGEVSFFKIHLQVQSLIRDGLMLLMGILSLVVTPKKLREENEFTWFPIKEVAYLFAGIFMTIIPALAILKAGTGGSLKFLLEAVKEPAHYYWITGGLSSFLDNAPTYLTFLNSALGNFFAGVPELQAVSSLIEQKEIYLKAISAGAVFMGANTYIGNAPNFMVKSIAEENGIAMPSFFGYMLKYSIPILIPLFVLVTLVFF